MLSSPSKGLLAAKGTGLAAALIAGTVMFAATSVEAARYKKININGWKGGVYTSNTSGRFSHCVVSAKYKSGITLLFSVTRGLKWKVGFSKPSWKMEKGNSYPVIYQVDKNKSKSSKARAATQRLAVINLPGSSNLFRQMRQGRILRIKAGDDILGFKLTGTSVMLKRLLNCAKRYEDLEVSPAVSSNSSKGSDSDNPFATAKKAPPARKRPANDNASGLRQEADNWFNVHLANAADEYTVIPNKGKAQRMYKKHAIVWRVGKKTGIVGTLRIFPRKKTATLENNVLAYEARSCKGDFASKFFKDDGIGSVAATRLMATCNTNTGKTWSSYYSITKRERGGVYLVTLLSSKAPSADVADAGERLTGTLQTGSGDATASPASDDLPFREDAPAKVKEF